MRKRLLTCLFALAMASAGVLAGGETSTGSSLFLKSGRLTIDGTCNVHDYTLTTNTLNVAGTIEGASALTDRALQAFEVEIPVNSFTADKEGLKERMAKALSADKHPTIVFRLTDYRVVNGKMLPRGTLTVAGVTREIDLILEVTEGADGIHVRGTRALSMKDFGIKPPTMMLGVLKTNEKITINFELLLERRSS